MGHVTKNVPGRPRKENPKNRILSIRMTEDDYGRLIETCGHYGIPIPDMINDTLNLYYRVLEKD